LSEETSFCDVISIYLLCLFSLSDIGVFPIRLLNCGDEAGVSGAFGQGGVHFGSDLPIR
jgi:hypothetical protein